MKLSQSLLLALILIFSGGCLDKKRRPVNSDAFDPPRQLAELKEKKLGEVSGLAASIANPGMIWVHNDSGNPATVYLIDKDLRIRLACKLKGIENRDWEDISVGPGPDGNKRYIYLADIGDNNARYNEKFIYRFPEPVAGKDTDMIITSFDKIVFQLSDGRKDTEAIMVHPQTRNIYIVSKREKPVHVYELQAPFGEGTLTAKSILTLPLTQIVAADISVAGDEILMKDYDNIYYWPLKGKDLREDLREAPQVLAYVEEPQGEAIGFSVDGSGFYTLSEKLRGEKTFLYFYQRSADWRSKTQLP